MGRQLYDYSKSFIKFISLVILKTVKYLNFVCAVLPILAAYLFIPYLSSNLVITV